MYNFFTKLRVNMKNLNTLLIALGTTMALSGCGGSGGSSAGAEDSKTTVTAIDGYLHNALIYKQNSNGDCLVNDVLLGTTDKDGQAQVNLTDLANGYCAVATLDTVDQDYPTSTVAEAFTLYSLTPRLLSQTEFPVISPFTTFIQNYVNEMTVANPSASEDDILSAINSAKIELVAALNLDGDDEAITDMLTNDYIKFKSSADTENLKNAAANLHVMAQLLVSINDDSQKISADKVINIAKSATTQIEAIAEDRDNSSTLLANIAIYIENNIDQFSDEMFSDEKKRSTLQADINNPVKLAQLPTQPSIEATSLASLLTTAITNGVEATGDSTINLVLNDIEFDGITTEGDSTYILTQKKADSIWDTEIVANSAENSAEFENDIYTVKELTFNQYGTFEFELYTQKTIIDGETDTVYNSKPVVFTVEISAEQVANTAPTYTGSDSEEATELLATLNTAAQDSYAFFDGSEFGLDTTFSISLRNSDLNSLFSDSNSLLVESSDLGAYLSYNDSTGLYFYSPSQIVVPSEGSLSVQVMLYAVDAQNAKSEQGFSYTVTVNSDLTATVTATDNSNSGNNNEAPQYGEEFYGVMLPTSYLTTLESHVADYLNGITPEPDVSMEQLFIIYTYKCSTKNTCIQKDGYLGAYSLDDNTYLKMITKTTGVDFTATYIEATGIMISEQQTVKLTPSESDNSVKIYKVENKTSTEISDINDFGSYIKLVISPDNGNGITVAASIENE
jgi:hypothetical protein